MTHIIDGYRLGLAGTLWATGAILGAATALGPWALGGWLLQQSWRTLRSTRTVWRIRAWRSTRRAGD